MTGGFATLLATLVLHHFGYGDRICINTVGGFYLFCCGWFGFGISFLLHLFRNSSIIYQNRCLDGNLQTGHGFTLIATTVWLVDIGFTNGYRWNNRISTFSLCVYQLLDLGKWGGLTAPPSQQIKAFLTGLIISSVAGYFSLTTDLP